MAKLEDVLESLYSEFPDEILDSDIEDDCGYETELITGSQLRSLPVDLDSSASISETAFESECSDARSDNQTESNFSSGQARSSPKDLDSLLSMSETDVESEHDEDNNWSPGRLLSPTNDLDSFLTISETAAESGNTAASYDHDEDIDLSPEITSTPPKKKKRRGDSTEYVWGKTVPTGREQLVYSKKSYVKSRTLNAQPSALNCFLSLFSEEVIKMVVDMTNKNYHRKEKERIEMRNARTKCDPASTPKSSRPHSSPWTDITVPEMKAFIALLIATGLVKMPTLAMYWRSTCAATRCVGFREVMGRDRFCDIYRHLRVADFEDETSQAPSNDQPNQNIKRDKLQKVRQFSELVRRNCMEKYALGKNVAIDESMIAFQGRVAFRQFLPAKRERYGIKVWVLAESGTSYVSNFAIYAGRETRDPQADPNRKMELGRAVVMSLMEPFLNEGRHLYTDNFYTSPALLDELYENGTYACGTVRRTKKGFPKDLIIQTTGASRCERGHFDWLMSGNILCYSWFDNRPVYIMSTIHFPDEIKEDGCTNGMVKRRWKSREPKEVPCPSVIKDYNRHMGGVDGNDQMRKYYNLNRKSRVWYRKVFGYLLEICVHNARVMLENIQGRRSQGIAFREDLIRQLIGGYRNKTVSIHNLPPRSILKSLRHDKSEWHLPKSGEYRAVCRYCSERAKAAKADGATLNVHRSTIFCTACHVALCFNGSRECFRYYHEEVKCWP